MSGIAGIIHFDRAPVEPGLIEQMTSAMACRGPDGIHHWAKGSVALGQCMLCTTPESLDETQPLTNEDETLVLVMDGRVDNREILQRELLAKGRTLRNQTDAEFVLRAYELWGHDCVTRIDGDFALVIWDVLHQVAFSARDRVGNKPFYYHWDGKTFAFGSELHTILSLPWVKQELNEGMLAEFLASEWYSRDETFWQGIMRLMAAYRMEVRITGLLPEQYWSPDLLTTLPFTEDRDFVEHYRALFVDVVRGMSRSYGPLACEVSGGLDSSAIFAVAEHLRQQHMLEAPSVDGYTLDFHDNQAADEMAYARAVGKHWDKKIYEISPSCLPISWYRQWAKHYRELPPYPNGSMGLGIRTEAASRGSRVLMIGIGGDEWLWGDRGYYAELLVTSQWRELFHCLKVDCRGAGFRKAIWWLARYGMTPLLPDIVKKSLRKFVTTAKYKIDDKQAWLTPSMRTVLEQRRLQYNRSLRKEGVRIGLHGQLQTLNSAFGAFARESEERLAASVEIELRYPFWHPAMVQFAFSTPTQRRLRGNTDRVLHRLAMAGLLPEVVLQRKTKANFMISFQAPLAELHKNSNEHVLVRRSSWVDPWQAKQLWDGCGHADLGGWPEFKLWTLFGCDCLADAKK